MTLTQPMSFVERSHIHRVARAAILKHDDMLARAIGEALGTVARDLQARIAALEATLNAMQATMSEFKYTGQWTEGQTYRPGNFCSMGGSIYHASTDTDSRPGTDSTWTLAVKSGRDGRDGRDAAAAPPPEPPASPEPRTARGTRGVR